MAGDIYTGKSVVLKTEFLSRPISAFLMDSSFSGGFWFESEELNAHIPESGGLPEGRRLLFVPFSQIEWVVAQNIPRNA
jgi:hypothetical protein